MAAVVVAATALSSGGPTPAAWNTSLVADDTAPVAAAVPMPGQAIAGASLVANMTSAGRVTDSNARGPVAALGAAAPSVAQIAGAVPGDDGGSSASTSAPAAASGGTAGGTAPASSSGAATTPPSSDGATAPSSTVSISTATTS
ncbi:MAG: hypothetical protein WCI61_01425 [Chloroflexota bacterium]